MGCIVELSKSLIQFEFNSDGNKQRILVDMLLKYSAISIDELALTLDISVDNLQAIYNGEYFLIGEQANDLAQIFLIFFGRVFFTKFSIIRNYIDECAVKPSDTLH